MTRRERRFALVAIALLPVCGFVTATPASLAATSRPQAASRPEAELSIRNATREPVRYLIRPFDADQQRPAEILRSGSIARFTTRYSLDLTFESAGRWLEYRLDPGVDYAFRYNNDEAVDLFLGSHDRADVPDLAPYVATPMPVVERMLELADVRSGDVVYDLGCGDGRIVVEAAKKYGARGVGVDLDPRRIDESKRLAQKARVEELVEFRVADATRVDFSSATVLALYLLPDSNELLRPIMEKRLRDGTRVVSHDYEVGGWTPVREESMRDAAGRNHDLYLYVLGRHGRVADR